MSAATGGTGRIGCAPNSWVGTGALLRSQSFSRVMVDRVYKGAFRSFRTDLIELRDGFARTDSKTDWNRLRIEPLLKHVDSLEAILKSKRFAGEVSRLRRGVPMFHSDLVYLRLNIRELRKTLDLAQRASARIR